MSCGKPGCRTDSIAKDSRPWQETMVSKDFERFRDAYSAATIKFIWDYGDVAEYVPVIQKAIEETARYCDIASVGVEPTDIGCAVLKGLGGNPRRFAFFIGGKRIRGERALYSIFKEEFNIVAKGYDDRLGVPIVSNSLERTISVLEAVGVPEKRAREIWEETQNLKRKITSFATLARKSLNRRRRVPPKLRLKVLARDGFRCALCGRTGEDTELHVDHITPVVKGGSNDIDNLITLCRACNLGKGSQTIGEWMVIT